MASRGAAVSAIQASEDEVSEHQSRSCVHRGSPGGSKSTIAVFYPGNGKTHTNRAPVDPGLFSPPLWYNTGQFHLLPT